ncbi:MAG: hypothetical protein C0624_04215 [Desulfuromonas sp.]|nr:MAG: hypothetical protein C0624_04215 [Desulfuromonas sp.]
MSQIPNTLHHDTDPAKARPWQTPGFWWFSLLTTGVLSGLVALTVVMLFGHTHEMNVGWEPPWGILVVTSHFFALASAGTCIAVPWLLPRDWPLPSEVSQKGLMTAGVAFFGALGVAVVELSQPVRLSFSADLGEGFMPGVYQILIHSLIYISCLAATCYSLGHGYRNRARLMSVLGYAVVMVVLFKSESLLVLFGHGASWLSAALPPVVTFSALLLGTALLLLVAAIPLWLAGKALDSESSLLMSRLVTLLTVLLVIQLVGEPLVLYGGAAWGGEQIALVSQLFVTGPLSGSFWAGEVSLGMIAPLVLLLTVRRHAWALCLSCLLVVGGQFMFWYDLLLATQLAKILTTSPLAVNGLLPRVAPCLPKLLITCGSLCLLLLLLSLNEKLQPYRD